MKVTVETIKPQTPNTNPFLEDQYHMGNQIGKNLWLMYPNHPDEVCKYLILVDEVSGERVRINIDGHIGKKSLSAKPNAFLVDLAMSGGMVEQDEIYIKKQS
jgi:hypothetical protein